MKRLIIFVLCAFLASAFTLIQLQQHNYEPEIHQFYGTVNGAPPNTVLIAKVGNTQFTTPVQNQQYGYNPLFYVTAQQGDTVTFWLNNTQVAGAVYQHYGATQLSFNYPGYVGPAATCTDGTQNQGESDVDCGGPCTPCTRGKNCNLDSDCQTLNCDNGVCDWALQCSNGVLDPPETDIDCGGTCPKCNNGQSCAQNTDCKSNRCVSNICKAQPRPPTGRGGGPGARIFYGDGVIRRPLPGITLPNATPQCNDVWTCAPWSACAAGVRTRTCWFNDDPTCEESPPKPPEEEQCGPEPVVQPKPEPTCFDGLLNQGEVDTDCGGPCAPCPEQVVPEERGIPTWLFWSIPLLAAIIALVAYMVMRPPTITDATSYVKYGLKQDFTKQEIADKMREAGYTDEEISEAFRKAA